jgi:hypothetical protein
MFVFNFTVYGPQNYFLNKVYVTKAREGRGAQKYKPIKRTLMDGGGGCTSKQIMLKVSDQKREKYHTK